MSVLQDYRKANDLSAADLARLIGVTRATVSRWESGDRRVDLRLLGAIESKTGLKRHDLRPDIFGPAPRKAAS